MKLKMYVSLAVLLVILIFAAFGFRHTKPAVDSESLAEVMRAVTDEPVLQISKLDNESTRFLVITGSTSQKHHYAIAWSGSKWQIMPSSDVKPSS